MSIAEKDTIYIFDKIFSLNEILWEGRLNRTKLERWQDNFQNEEERQAALFLLSKFMFFNEKCIHMLLEALYRDLYRYPIIKQIRYDNGNTLDENIIEPEFKKILNTTLFECVGTNSESSTHLQYPFRQVTGLSESLFRDYEWDVDPLSGMDVPVQRPINICVFIDDFCGTGSQVTKNKEVKTKVAYMRNNYPGIKIFYYTLISTLRGKDFVKRFPNLFDDVDSVVDLDDTFECFSGQSRIFDKGCPFNKETTEVFCKGYGKELMKHYLKNVEKVSVTADKIDVLADYHSLGFHNCQLLMGMHHNVPDNTLPIIWYDEDHALWNPIFKRSKKI